jgi:hypothetical protein
MRKRRITARPEFGMRLSEFGISIEALDRVTYLSIETLRRYIRATVTGRRVMQRTARNITNGVVRLTGREPAEVFDLLFTKD